MKNTTSKPTKPDLANVQGFIMRGYSHPFSCHLLYKFLEGKSSPGKFFKPLLPHVQSAAHWGDKKPQRLLNIGITYTGLTAMKIPNVDPEEFPIEFRLGPDEYYSQQSLCDLGTSSPERWKFGSKKNPVDVVVHCYAMNRDSLIEIILEVTAAAKSAMAEEIVPDTGRYFGNPTMGTKIHFGYRDGIDQPNLSWPDPWPGAGAFSDPEAVNNFLVGYPSSLFMPGPSLTDDETAAFAKDGSYNALRVSYQDVHLFEKFLTVNAPAVMTRLGFSEEQAKKWIAARLNGRWQQGSPTELSPHRPSPETELATNFTYSWDTEGKRCPFSAHTRVANPRNQPIFSPNQPVPRILRRGVPYGDIPLPPDFEGEQGLIGIFICGSISQQFEKILGWINRNDFSNVFTYNSQDALLANRKVPQVINTFTIPMHDGGEPLVFDLNDYQFVVTRGTAYCFLPSLKALQTIANTAN